MIDRLKKEKCTGCRNCELVCPRNCIKLVPDEEGFLYPRVDLDICDRCGRCKGVCNGFGGITEEKSLIEQEAFWAVNCNQDVLRVSSAGGVFGALAEFVLEQNGIVYGAAFAKDFSVEQRRVERAEDLPGLMGIKLAQSDTKRTFCEVRNDLAAGRSVLYTGTPCQLSALRRYVGEDKRLFCVSIICEGMPSPLVWQRYLVSKGGLFFSKEPTNASFYDKSCWWLAYSLRIDFETGCYQTTNYEDPYMLGYMQGLFLRPSCYECQAKRDYRFADIVVGDYWGGMRGRLGKDLNEGCAIICSDQGRRLWDAVQNKLQSRQIDCRTIADLNPAIKTAARKNVNRGNFFRDIHESGVLVDALKRYLNFNTLTENDRRISQYAIVDKYLDRLLDGDSPVRTMERLGWKNVALYATTDLMEYLMRDIQRSGRIGVTISCRNAGRYKNGYKGVPVAEIPDLCQMEKNGALDAVIVCNPLRENDIFDELIRKGFPVGKIYSISSVVFD